MINPAEGSSAAPVPQAARIQAIAMPQAAYFNFGPAEWIWRSRHLPRTPAAEAEPCARARAVTATASGLSVDIRPICPRYRVRKHGPA